MVLQEERVSDSHIDHDNCVGELIAQHFGVLVDIRTTRTYYDMEFFYTHRRAELCVNTSGGWVELVRNDDSGFSTASGVDGLEVYRVSGKACELSTCMLKIFVWRIKQDKCDRKLE